METKRIIYSILVIVMLNMSLVVTSKEQADSVQLRSNNPALDLLLSLIQLEIDNTPKMPVSSDEILQQKKWSRPQHRISRQYLLQLLRSRGYHVRLNGKRDN